MGMSVSYAMITMVQHLLKSFHPIREEIDRWRKILGVPYQEHYSVSESWELHALYGNKDLKPAI
jgi:hypothetical protein